MKIFFPAAVLAIMFSACNFNEQNFPGYDDGVAPTNKFAYTDSITDADMIAISKMALAFDTTKTDSALTKELGVNKYFKDNLSPASKYIPMWLAKKYKYGDPKSYVIVTTPQYIASEGELMYIKEKYVLDSSRVFHIYRNEIFAEPFLTSIGNFTAVSVVGAQVWTWNTYKSVGYMKFSGYSGGNQNNEDWLISPAIDLSKRASAYLKFDNTHKYGTNFDKEMTLWVSDNWDGVATPDTLNWVKKTFIKSLTNDYTFVSSGPVSLTEYANKSNIRIAFRYVSNTRESCPTWEIKNVQVIESLEE
ncbi:MAG TPA: choice-of-anchor J domain-containing protein [Bacteroidales bacterium]|nr:choice-of-anchor J domain-containing protein [Bacteroidales bacterium]